MPPESSNHHDRLTGHALRNAHLRERSLARAATAPPLAQAVVRIRAGTLQLTRLELSRRSGISRGALRDLELGIHTPTRQTLQQFVTFCQKHGASPQELEELRRLYAGPGSTLGEFVARLELKAGSSRELARRVGISPTTLWQYRRGSFPLPLELLHRLCEAVGEAAAGAEQLWHAAHRQRLLERGLPEAWAELCVLCARAGHPESHLLSLGIGTSAFRRLRYLELPLWSEVEPAAQALCRDEKELRALESLWSRNRQEQQRQTQDGFGRRLKELRQRQEITRRALADLFGIGGKKPARIIKHIEEDGFYSVQAYPAGLVAVLTADAKQQARLLKLWQDRRRQFHRRRRPETRIELRLAREMYGLEIKDMHDILGYTNLEYQRIERGVNPLRDTAQERILQAIHQAGRQRVADLLRQREAREVERSAWQRPTTVIELIARLGQREGGLIPLARLLRRAGLKGLWAARLRAVVQGEDVPPWPVLEEVGVTCGVDDLEEVQRDWTDRYRAQLQKKCSSPLGVEVRLLIGEAALTLRDLSPKLGFNYSVLIRNMQRIDRDQPVKWAHVERILRVVGLPVDCPRWREIHALWYTAGERRRNSDTFPRRLLG
jgi:transcriptional regulator with XRE-family HTH domain